MPIATPKIMPCLWFDTEAEAAAKHYVSIFKNSKIGRIGRYGKEGKEIHGKAAGIGDDRRVRAGGQKFLALNGGPQFKFDEAVSFQVFCETQAEVDYFWSKLSEGGSEGRCGWLKDKFGLSWQVVPTIVPEMLQDEKSAKANRVLEAILQMKKIDIAALAEGLRRLSRQPATAQATPTPTQGESHASAVLPVLQRPLRRSDRVLQEDARRQGRDADALQGRPGGTMPTAGMPKTRSCTRASASATRWSWRPTCDAGRKPEFKGFSLSLNAKDEAEAERLFNALADGGQVQQPLIKTFFSPSFGMVADKFGVGWMVIVDPEPRRRPPEQTATAQQVDEQRSANRRRRLRHLARVRCAARAGVEVLHRSGAHEGNGGARRASP